jgi:hypothetical protein
MIRRIWQRNPLLSAAFLLAVASCLFFTWRAVDMALILTNRAEKPVAGWMTPRYIANSYGLDRDDLAALLDTADGDDARQPLYALAREQDVPVIDMIRAVQALIDSKVSSE